GRGKIGSKRLALHARSIIFTHPFSGKQMTFDTGIPGDFVRLLGKLSSCS
ncbi:MAG: RNA pseudouridine synthase, partial [Candidatus Zixiibacteriota bacterium]